MRPLLSLRPPAFQMRVRDAVFGSLFCFAVQSCSPGTGEQIQAPERAGAPLFSIDPNGPTFQVAIKGQTFIGNQGAFLTPTRSRCANVLISWFPDEIGLYHPYPQPDTTITGDGGIHTYSQQQCGAVQPAGGGQPINGGQIQVDQSLNGPVDHAYSIPADLSKEGLLALFPAGATVTLFGQPANGDCVFDQWRIDGVGNSSNPIDLTVQANMDIVGWFICGGSPPPPPGPPPPPPPDPCISCPPSEEAA